MSWLYTQHIEFDGKIGNDNCSCIKLNTEKVTYRILRRVNNEADRIVAATMNGSNKKNCILSQFNYV